MLRYIRSASWLAVACIILCTQAHAQPPVIPMPVKAQWHTNHFQLPEKGTINYTDSRLKSVADQYRKVCSSLMLQYEMIPGHIRKKNTITLSLTSTPFKKNEKEAYSLRINAEGIKVTANDPHGIFNALQTLRQLIYHHQVRYCTIIDEPAYQWRGYMVDVGRNYQPVTLLKQQIDAMALAKLNVFHFHATEHIAWRFESKKYPQLNAPENMTRDAGLYYTESELKDIIQYCKARYIEFVPEIDMPGHSDAFTRAMGFGMQTPQGLAAVKQIIKEFTDTYDFNYLHLGADEVKITMPDFLPEMVKFVNTFSKKIIAWWPGKITSTHIIRNLWLGDAGEKEMSEYVSAVDSRHTYLNHLDPLESVVTLYFRQYSNVITGDRYNMGATLCLWPDRKVNNPYDAVKANAVYPAMLAFAERIWRGGGIPGFISNIPAEKKLRKEFEAFENRLLSVQKRFFSRHHFTYTRQADIEWELFGPFDNNGDVNRAFPIENNFDGCHEQPFQIAYGGTVILRHFWHPTITGLLNNAKQNSTIYARTRIWSPQARIAKCWIGFNNISRSPATDAPPIGKWNAANGQLWVNNVKIPPPVWQRGGQRGNPEIPLTDEDYAYRHPTIVSLKKGWNTVWAKVPVATFKGKDWQNPVKWMFTFAELR